MARHGGPRRRERLAGLVLLAALPGFLLAFMIWPAVLLAAISLFVSDSPAARTASEEGLT